MNTPDWTALVIFYIISLHTVANHSDDNHYHTAVNIINCKAHPVEVTSSHEVPSPAHDEADSTRWRKSHRELCTKFLLDRVCNSIQKAIRWYMYTLHSSLELGSLRYSSECEKAPACGHGELALLQRHACIFSGTRAICELMLNTCKYSLHYVNDIHCGMVMYHHCG